MLAYPVALIGLTALLVYVDFFDKFYRLTRKYEAYELDEMVLAVLAGIICLGVYSFFRFRENKELKRVRNELAEANTLLIELNRAKEDFMAVACHELKSPLCNMVNAMSLLESTSSADEGRKTASLAKGAAEGLLAVADDVLELTRVSQDQEVVRVGYSPSGLLDSIRDIALLQADAKGLVLRAEVRGNVPETVVGNEAGVRLVFLNLVSNAIKYTESGGVSINLAYTPGEERGLLEFKVTDTGVGIPEGKLTTIFEPFQRVHKEKAGGLGLGLTIVRRIVEMIDGTVTVSSVEGQGSEFVATFPVIPA